MERTFVMIKPLGLQNFLLQIITGLKGVGTITKRELIPVNEQLISAHYAEHSAKAHFDRIVQYFIGQTVMGIVLVGPDVIARVRAILGPSDPRKAAPGQLRRLVLDKFQDGKDGWRVIELATSGVDNLVHASDSPEAAEREISLWFTEKGGQN